MTFREVHNSPIKAIGYDEPTQRLQVRFEASTHEFEPITAHQHLAFCNSKNKITFFQKMIRPLGGKKVEKEP